MTGAASIATAAPAARGDDPRPGGADGFRSDINGLRAISIAAVVAFHLANRVAPGGFVGVDVFFVISGYLMTRIILGRLEAGRFRLGGFYLARLRRIGPALAALCAGLWLFGALGLDPWTFQGLAVKLPYALLFISNVMFANRGGYFAEDSGANWFLHTWSLSVEWQFYLIHPLVLMALFAWKPARRRLWTWLAAFAIASFALAALLPERDWTLDFYLLPTRAWELLAGALCVAAERRLALRPGIRALLHAGGLLLIGFGIALARPGGHWPSFLTLLPAGGAALVIVAALRRTWWAENPLVDGLGRASYSIYVWHWPIVVWLHDNLIPITWPVALAALAGMLGLGAASYWLIERRLTDWLFQPKPGRWVLGVGVTTAILALAGAAAATHGLEALRTLGAPPAIRAALAEDRRAADDWTYPKICGRFVRQGRMELCQIGDPAARQVLVLGDSHAEQIAPRYAHAFDGRHGAGLTVASIPGCIPIPHVSERGSLYCGQAWAEAYRYAERARFARVLIVANWQPYFNPSAATPQGITQIDGGPIDAPVSVAALADADFRLLAQAVRRLQTLGTTVVLLGTSPPGGDGDPRSLYGLTFWRGQLQAPPVVRSQYAASAALARQRLAWLSRTTGAVLLDPLAALCTQDLCPVMDGGKTLYKDHGHFRASMMTSPRFAYLDPWIAPAAGPIRLK
jgi:peptidoglycan/LPS O-acetylase OafA/YrhL